MQLRGLEKLILRGEQKEIILGFHLDSLHVLTNMLNKIMGKLSKNKIWKTYMKNIKRLRAYVGYIDTKANSQAPIYITLHFS